MKILHITDSHGTMKSPESRTDIYYLAFLKKMYELKYVIKQYNINLIIHTGDLFHTPRVSDKFTGALAEIIKSYGIPMYVVPGNHDIDGYSISTIDQTKLGLLYKTGVVRELDREHPIQLISHKDEELSVNIYGQEYYKDIDTGNVADYSIQDSSSADFNILAVHGYLCDKPQNPNIRHTLCQNIVTDADVILSGHFHESFSYRGSDFSAYNPGSLMRVEQNAYNQKHMPQYGILEINKQNGQVTHSYTFHQFKIAQPSDKVFDYTKKFATKKKLLSIDNFKQTLAQTSANINSQNLDIENMIINTANASGADKFVYTKAMGAYDDALQASTGDKTFVVNGYTEDKTYKYITKVKIHNFQSHKDTTVEFKDGMNVIVGESNSGKCVRGDSYVKTKSGLRQIKDLFTETLKEDTFYDTNESVIITGNTEKLGALYYSGIKKSILISLSNGRELECSYEEPLLIWNSEKFCEEFKKACDLTTDDLLIRDVKPVKINKTNVLQEIDWSYDKTVYANYLLQHENISNVNELQDKVKCSHAAADRNFYHRNNFNIILPKYLNEDLAYIIGLIDGDGCISNGYYCTSDEFLKNEYTRIIKENFNESVDFIERKGLLYTKGANGTFSLIVKGIMKAQGQNANTKKVPQIIKMSPWHIQLEYVKGIMDTDGSVDKNGRLELSMNSKDIVLFVKEFVESIGYDGVLTKRGKSWRYCFSHSRFTTNHESLFRLPRKKEREIQKEKLTGPNKEILKGSAKWFKTQNISFTREQRKQITGHTISDYNVRDITVSAYNTFIDKANKLGIHIERRIPEYHTVCSINGIKENVCDLYDVTNPISHTFTANGFIVHNTTILRSIRWVLDNTPKGSDFITSGEDECSVVVTFSDGTSIERTRTRNDAGEYRVHGKIYQPYGTITFWNQVYKGFNNDIPVDVCNTHQTPKVNLTKDISTHLNIMSQLDGPFLITESPLNKAAIIGRLAGSQIIDEAIKRVNRDILANSKAHKLYEEQLENKQYELKKYDDVDIEKQFINIATIIDDNISMRNARIMDINIKEQAYKNTYRDTIAYSNQYVTANLNAKALENVIRILDEQKRIYSLITKLNSYKVKETEVKNLTIKSKWLGIISLFNEFYGICTTKLLDTSGLVKTYSAYQENSGIISALTSKKEIIEAVDESGTLIENVLSTKNNNIQTGYNMYNQYLSMNASLDDINMEFQEASDKVDKLTESLDDIETEKDKVIKDNNICPCCGRKLSTKDQIHHVKNFMEEMLNGRTV